MFLFRSHFLVHCTRCTVITWADPDCFYPFSSEDQDLVLGLCVCIQQTLKLTMTFELLDLKLDISHVFEELFKYIKLYDLDLL